MKAEEVTDEAVKSIHKKDEAPKKKIEK